MDQPLRQILQTHGTGEDSYYTNPVCTAGDWWVTTAIDVIFVMILLAVTLWIVKLFTGIYANWSSAKAKS